MGSVINISSIYAVIYHVWLYFLLGIVTFISIKLSVCHDANNGKLTD